MSISPGRLATGAGAAAPRARSSRPASCSIRRAPHWAMSARATRSSHTARSPLPGFVMSACGERAADQRFDPLAAPARFSEPGEVRRAGQLHVLDASPGLARRCADHAHVAVNGVDQDAVVDLLEHGERLVREAQGLAAVDGAPGQSSHHQRPRGVRRHLQETSSVQCLSGRALCILEPSEAEQVIGKESPRLGHELTVGGRERDRNAALKVPSRVLEALQVELNESEVEGQVKLSGQLRIGERLQLRCRRGASTSSITASSSARPISGVSLPTAPWFSRPAPSEYSIRASQRLRVFIPTTRLPRASGSQAMQTFVREHADAANVTAAVARFSPCVQDRTRAREVTETAIG